MTNLLKLFSLIQLTKEQPVSGYVIGGLKIQEVPSLAEHHYTATLMAYFMTQSITNAGGEINQNKVVAMTLIHDLSELFGGDIAGPLNRKYPDLREYKDRIGDRAVDVLCEFMDASSEEEFRDLFEEMKIGTSDEAIVTKIIDQMDHQFFLEHHNFKSKYDPGYNDYRPGFFDEHIMPLTSKISDKNTKDVMNRFLKKFKDKMFNKGFQSMSILMED